MKTLAERIREQRVKLGLTQNELDECVGAARSTVSQYETAARTPSARALIELSIALNVSVDWLLGID